MSTQPKVSIILVNYNGYRDTIECIQSLRKITYTNYEIIVVDNASTNESVDEIKSFISNGEILLLSKINGGFSAGNNIGMRYAMEHEADYCLLLNNDTLVEPDFLDKLIEGFELFPDCGMVIGKIIYESKRDTVWYAGGSISKKTAKTTHWHYREKDEGLSEEPQKVTFATGCCMCLKKNAIKAIGYMNESYFLYEEDAEYCMRILKADFSIIYIPAARIYHKISASTGDNSPAKQYYTVRNKYTLIKEHIESKYKLVAYSYTTIRCLYNCINNRTSIKFFFKGMRSFLKNEKGKQTTYHSK